MNSIGIYLIILSFIFYYKPRFIFNYIETDEGTIITKKKFGIASDETLCSFEIVVILIVIFSFLFTKKINNKEI